MFRNDARLFETGLYLKSEPSEEGVSTRPMTSQSSPSRPEEIPEEGPAEDLKEPLPWTRRVEKRKAVAADENEGEDEGDKPVTEDPYQVVLDQERQ